ncbi:fumarylacetoacetate hydrolase family protein [Brevundimonas sp. AJA228-03]|uniref:fumarylacetoacetate hydrolase family protein n=1 Tax=Brevundimonas sp. AJA228-03 TaxID=2752515 RepID=UPI001AE0A895|nr:fumarylacetoacetate hydrolase family protein [Brevundimonas sp. AJA228-03]QTN19232.1 fumarylacetoacetate hydrolase family protein [Brevundimonas sp. AJA228-03]
MKIVSFERQGRAGYGVLEGDRIAVAPASGPADLKAALASGGVAAVIPSGESIALSDVTLLPVLPNPGKILCVGHNYEDHRKETGRAKVDHPSIFTRWADTLVAGGQPIVRPQESTDLDYEGELAVVIGRGGRRISREAAMDHVAGYTIANDASVRDWQWHTHQFTPGKNFPDTCALGPWLMTPDEMGPLDRCRITTRVNGEVVQDAGFDQMIFSIADIIAYCSGFTTLSPGDVILTGTPGGVGAKRTPPLWLKPGDVVEVTVTGLGVLSNPVSEDASA